MPVQVSCIVPAFNGERYLGEALESIFAQTHPPFEVIVADDGSTDGTAALVASYGARVRHLVQPNAGPAAARNLGLRAATGNFIAFLDADDCWHPEKLSRQLARFEARPELDVSATQVQNFWMPELMGHDPRYHDPRHTQPWPGFTCPSMLARREVFDTVGGFDPSLWLAEDNDWFMRAREHGKVIELIPEVLLYRRYHGSNLTTRLAAQRDPSILRALRASIDRRRRASTLPRG
jgi:glycosyltransferase involved in cell wall biosynthesis